MTAIAGAPVSFGVFELTPEGQETIGPDELLGILADTGHDGVDLGPGGFLGRGPALRERLERHGLALAGGWIQLPFAADEGEFAASLPELDEALALLRDAGAASGPAPRPTLADAGSPARAAAPGRGAEVDPLDDARWEHIERNVDRAVARAREAGFEPTFHHHAGTAIESVAEIQRFLDSTDVGLTLDTGHLVLGGGDPVEAARAWGDRIDHLHVKDVDRADLERVLDAGGGMREVWSAGVFVAFGAGDLDLPGTVDALRERGFDGWVVIEQDVLPGPDADLASFVAGRAADQRTNIDALHRILGASS